ncbi:hypothetical protein K438DRAFT_1806731 [Mycena galopus ATCC 62051]|nr:hypothetical protein K438DRAFT_1806731 [Mycena galopus ATCC 62051]
MLLRVRSLKGVCILRPFCFEAISTHISEELRQQLERTEVLEKRTIKASRRRLEWYYKVFPLGLFAIELWRSEVTRQTKWKDFKRSKAKEERQQHEEDKDEQAAAGEEEEDKDKEQKKVQVPKRDTYSHNCPIGRR